MTKTYKNYFSFILSVDSIMDDNELDALGKTLGIDPEIWELAKIGLKNIKSHSRPLSETGSPMVIDERLLQKKLTDFLPKEVK
jgi:hypothetical protein